MKVQSKVKVKEPRLPRKPEVKTPTVDPKPAPFKKSYELLDPTRFQLGQVGGRGGKKPSPHRIEEFYPRGAAGRREIHGLTGTRKNVLPNHGNRTKNPK